jgi:hypothetical protein
LRKKKEAADALKAAGGVAAKPGDKKQAKDGANKADESVQDKDDDEGDAQGSGSDKKKKKKKKSKGKKSGAGGCVTENNQAGDKCESHAESAGQKLNMTLIGVGVGVAAAALLCVFLMKRKAASS